MVLRIKNIKKYIFTKALNINKIILEYFQNHDLFV